MTDKNDRSEKQTTYLNGAFRTFPLADDYQVEEVSGESIPSQEEAEQARRWVNFKEM